MKIAIDISPLHSGHSIRGQGFYLSRLKTALEKNYSSEKFLFFQGKLPQTESFDIVHYPYFEPFILSLPFKKSTNTIVTVHDLTPLIFPKLFPVGMKGRLKWEFQKQSLRLATRIITDSQASKKDIIRLTGISAAKIDVVYLAAGDEFGVMNLTLVQQDALRNKYHLPKKFMLYIGDVTPNKNIVRLVQVCKTNNIPLVMVGKALAQTEYDDTHPWNKDLATVHKITHEIEHIQLLGFVPTDDLVALYNLATVFVFPSLYEGFGLPVLEAMQSGCPVITTHGGSLAEVADDAAYIIDPLSEKSLFKGITEMMESEKLRNKYKEKGIKQAAKFSWNKTAKETMHVYEKAR